MPFIFEKIADYTEILLPDNLLSEGSVIRDMVKSINEDEWHEVEIIGWLYQFYISEKKDEVFASKSKIKKEEIPAATQLFTPDWIVKYMVENSLGRYWLETYPNEHLKENWKYYLEEPEQEKVVQEQLDKIRDRDIKPDEITVLDPACGSGHILVYAFDVLYELYKSVGYMEADIPQLILNNNLYGLEICDRAGQLASFSIMMKVSERENALKFRYRWFIHNKGGRKRKWYGNLNNVLNYTYNSINYMESLPGFRHDNKDYYFKNGINWGKMSSNSFSARITDFGCTFDSAGTSGFPPENMVNYILGLLNTKVANDIFSILNPTLSVVPGNVYDLPFKLVNELEIKNKIDGLVNSCLEKSKIDWDSFETSWDFKKHPLLTHKKDAKTIEESFNNWSDFAEKQFYQLKENEEELNRIFIDIYGLEDELTPEVLEKDVTVRKADRGRDIRSFISYVVGCMLGRYSRDKEGLVYAGGEFDESRYKTFEVDKDGIIPVLDEEYFDDDIVAKFVEFLKIIFGQEQLEENLEYIADALIESGTSAQKTSRVSLV